MNRKYIVTTALFSVSCMVCVAQSLGEVMSSVVANNPLLAAALSDVDADRMQNFSEASLSDLEIEFNYLWGQNHEIGNRRDFSVTQSIDMASLSGMRRRQAESKTELSLLEYRIQRKELLLQVSSICMDLVYLEAMINQCARHLDDCSILTGVTEKRLDLGEGSVLEFNKARLHQSSVKGQLDALLLERDLLHKELVMLNGNKSISFDASSYVSLPLPDDFQEWMDLAGEGSEMLQYMKKASELDQRQVAVEKASSLPSLTFGYMSELGLTDRYRGLTMGVSIPLWNNNRKVREATARSKSSQLQLRDAENRLVYTLTSLYSKALSQSEILSEMKASIRDNDNRDYLLEAAVSGEISMLDYLQEMDLYYETLQECLSVEREYNMSVSRLYLSVGNNY